MIEITMTISLVILLLALLLAFLRLFRGPYLHDRVVALDLIASLAAGLILLFMVKTGEKRYMDIVVILSLIVFLGTVAIARFIKKEKK